MNIFQIILLKKKYTLQCLFNISVPENVWLFIQFCYIFKKYEGIPMNHTFCSVPHLKLVGNMNWALAGICDFLAEEFYFQGVCEYSRISSWSQSVSGYKRCDWLGTKLWGMSECLLSILKVS